jgi:hypothetical protein
MSAIMSRQGGWVQLEQSDMRLVLNVAKMPKEGFSQAAIEETKYLIQKQRAEVRQEKKRGIEFPGLTQVKVAIQRHPAMLCQNHTPSYHPWQNGTAKNPQTCWRYKGSGAPPTDRRRQGTPKPTPPPPSTPPTPTGNTSGAQHSQIVNLPVGYRYSHTDLSCRAFFDHDEDTQHDTNCDPHMLTDAGTHTG